MKKALLMFLITGRMAAMDVESQLIPADNNQRIASAEIAAQIANLIIQYDHDNKSEDDKFKTLVISYFKKESFEIESRITPHLRDKLRQSDSDIKQILENDDRDALETLIHKLITESIEDAFKDQNNQFEELKQLADTRLQKSKYALVIAVVTGILGIAGTFLGAYFGH